MTLDQLVRVLYESSNDAREVLSKIKDVATSNDNVVLTFYDGSTLTIPSLPQLQNTVNNFVNNAETNIKSWWNREFYVDSDDGSDDNDGSQNAPFKTIKKAVDSVPVGGYAMIFLKKEQTHIIDSIIEIRNKTIVFKTYQLDRFELASNAWIENTCYINPNGNETNGFRQTNGKVYFQYVNIRTANFADPNKPMAIWEGLFRRFDNVTVNAYFFKSIIELGDTDLARVPTGTHGLTDLYFFTCNIKQVGPNRAGLILLNEAGNYSIGTTNETTVTLQDGSTGNLNDLIGGQILSTNHLQNFGR